MLKELFNILIIGDIVLFIIIGGYIYSKAKIKQLECDNGKKRAETKKE